MKGTTAKKTAGKKAPGRKRRTQKEAYIDRMAAQLKNWSSKIDELEARASETAAGVKSGYRARLVALRRKRRELATQLRAVQRTGGRAWTALRTGVTAAKQDLARAIKAARDTVRKAA